MQAGAVPVWDPRDTLKLGPCTRGGGILWPGKTNSWSKDNEAGRISSEKEYQRVVGSSLPPPSFPTRFILLDTCVAGLSLSNFFVAWKSLRDHIYLAERRHYAAASQSLPQGMALLLPLTLTQFSQSMLTLFKKKIECALFLNKPFSMIPIQLVILSLI